MDPEPLDRPSKPDSALTALLTGMMGSGKSTVGRIAASRLGIAFADLDERIESETGQSIQSLFRTQGESAFRRLEAEALSAILSRPPDAGPLLVSTGGGTLCQPESWERLPPQVRVLWLDAPVPVLCERLAEDRSRPLLEGRDSLPQRLAELLEARLSSYQRADHRVDATAEPEVVALEVVAWLQRELTR